MTHSRHHVTNRIAMFIRSSDLFLCKAGYVPPFPLRCGLFCSDEWTF